MGVPELLPPLGRDPSFAGTRRTALLLALCQVGDQLSPSAGRPVEPGDSCYLRFVDEGHPCAADGVGDRVCADDHDRLRVPGPPLWGLGGTRHGGIATAHAQTVWSSALGRDRYPGPVPLGRHGAGFLEWASPRPRASL